jgi:hypothetical protein
VQWQKQSARKRQARRYWRRTCTEQKWVEFQGAGTAKKTIIAKAKQAHWRAAVYEAAISSQGIWKLAKWARTKSHLPKEPAKMPNLRWNRSLKTTVNKKAAALQERFYPTVAADLADIIDPILAGGTPATELQIDRTAAEWEVYRALKSTKPNKCPGADEIPNRFLLAMGQHHPLQHPLA